MLLVLLVHSIYMKALCKNILILTVWWFGGIALGVILSLVANILIESNLLFYSIGSICGGIGALIGLCKAFPD